MIQQNWKNIDYSWSHRSCKWTFSLNKLRSRIMGRHWVSYFAPLNILILWGFPSTLAWQIPWTEKPGRLQSIGSLEVGYNWATSLSLFTFRHWRRKWQPTQVFLPGESQGRGSLVGCHLWGRTESDTTEATQQQQQQCILMAISFFVSDYFYIKKNNCKLDCPLWRRGCCC